MEPSAGRDPIEQLADSFLARFRAGERPGVEEYLARYPELADQVRELLPALVLMEQGGSAGGLAPAAGPAPLGRLGDYVLLREVGRGGMGVVYEAVQLSLGRHVALKVLPPAACRSRAALERFRREARAAAKLHHTNIVPVFGVGEDAGTHYYAMQFIQGTALDAVLREVKRFRDGAAAPTAGEGAGGGLAASVAETLLTGRLPGAPAAPLPPSPTPQSQSGLTAQPYAEYYRSVARLGVQVAEALAYAHGQGVVHRDLKPANLLLDTGGRPWVADFGLAKLDDADELTALGDVVGTPRYMAPERFQGVAGPACDIYGLGATLYEMLTLRPAFADADRLALLERIRREAPPRPRALDPHVPADLETVVLKAMAKEPADRYPSADDLAEDLRRFLADRPLRARRASALERAWRWCRRNRTVALLTASVVLLLALTAAGLSVLLVRLRGAYDEAVRAKEDQRVQNGVALAERERRQGAERQELERRRESVRALLARARALSGSGVAGQRFDVLEAVEEAVRVAGPLGEELRLELRNQAVAGLARYDLRPAPGWGGAVGPGEEVGFDAALGRYATAGPDGHVTVRRAADGKELLRLPLSPAAGASLSYVAPPQFSPDGLYLEAHRKGRLGRWRTAVWRLEGPPAPPRLLLPASHFVFLPHGRGAALLPDGALGVYDLASGRELKRVGTALADTTSRAPLSAAGEQVVVVNTRDRVVRQVDPQAGTVRDLGWVPEVAADGILACSADGRLAALTAVGDHFLLYALPEWALVGTLGHGPGGVDRLAFSPAEDLLASHGANGLTALWGAYSGKFLVAARGRFVRFAADGRHLAYVDGTRVGRWEVSARPPLTTLLRLARAVDFSPDGRLLAVAGRGVGLWDVATGRELARLNLTRCGTAVFHPGGRALCTHSREGLRRWPLRGRPAAPGQWELAPPEPLDVRAAPDGPAGGGRGPLNVFLRRQLNRDASLHGEAGEQLGRAAFTPQGRLAALEEHGQGLVLSPDRPAARAFLPQERAATFALSPDGRWAAVASRGAGTVRVWDLSAAKVVKELPNQDGPAQTAYAAFSPDGRRLVTSGPREHRFWDVGTWELSRALPRDRAEAFASPVAFSADGRLLALCPTQELVQLVEPDTGRELVTLSRPGPANVSGLCFSRDGGRLAVASWSKDVAVWDLRAVRRELAARGLDWRPPAGPAPAEKEGGPVAIHVLAPGGRPAAKPEKPGTGPPLREAERLPVVGRERCETSVQDMGRWNRSLWSEGRQLFCEAMRGGYVELEVPCPAAGHYRLAVGLTRADDYGVVQVSLDGKKVGEPFDGFNGAVVPSGKIEFGTVELTRGAHRVRFTAVGKNARSKNFYMGIDYLELRPVK